MFQRRDFVLTDLEDHIGIQYKVVMTQKISNAFCTFPINMGIKCLKINTADFIELFQLLTYCD